MVRHRTQSKVRKSHQKQQKGIVWDDEMEKSVLEAFALQRKRRFHIRSAVFFGLATAVCLYHRTYQSSNSGIAKMFGVPREDANGHITNAAILFAAIFFWSLFKAMVSYNDTVESLLKDSSNQALVGLDRFSSPLKSRSRRAKKADDASRKTSQSGNGSLSEGGNSSQRSRYERTDPSRGRRMGGSALSPDRRGTSASPKKHARFRNNAWHADLILGRTHTFSDPHASDFLNDQYDIDLVDEGTTITDKKSLDRFLEAREFDLAIQRAPLAPRGSYASTGPNKESGYKCAPRESSENVGHLSTDWTDNHVRSLEQLRKLGIEDKIDRWSENIRLWLKNVVELTFLEPLELNMLYLNKYHGIDKELLEHKKKKQTNYVAPKAGAHFMRAPRKNANCLTFPQLLQTVFTEQKTSQTMDKRFLVIQRQMLQSFLRVFDDQSDTNSGYVLSRIKQLMDGDRFGMMEWGGGGMWKSRPWTSHKATQSLPETTCDSHIIMNLFVQYMNSLELPKGNQGAKGQNAVQQSYQAPNMPYSQGRHPPCCWYGDAYDEPPDQQMLRLNHNRSQLTPGENAKAFVTYCEEHNEYGYNLPVSFSEDRFDVGMSREPLLPSTPYIKCERKYPPMYVVVHNNVTYTPRPRHYNVFDTITIFLYFVQRDLGGILAGCPDVHDRNKEVKRLREVLRDELLCDQSTEEGYLW